MIATTKRFTEIARAAAQGRVDADSGILYGVKLLGSVSRNGRRYSETAMYQAVPLYADKKIYIDHPTKDRMTDDRSFHDFIGVIKNPRKESGGIFGDVHLLKESPHYKRVIEIAQNHPNSIGCSHVADGESRMDGGEEIIESIDRVFSVDLVMDAATTAGLFESKQDDERAKAFEMLETMCGEAVALMRELGVLLADGDSKAVKESHHRAPPSWAPRELGIGNTDFNFTQPGSFAARYRQ